MFFGAFGQDSPSIVVRIAGPPSLATEGAMRETMRT